MPNNNPKSIPIERHYDQRFTDLEKNLNQRFDAMDKALKLAYDNMKERLNSMNEIREQLREQANTFVAKIECNPTKNRFEEDIRMLRESKAMLEGKASQKSVNIALIFTFFSLLVSILSLWIAYNK